MNVAGAVVRGVSMTYATTVGNEEATASVMMEPEADHVKISIWPGVSTRMWLHSRDISTRLTEDGRLLWMLTLLFLRASQRSLAPDRISW